MLLVLNIKLIEDHVSIITSKFEYVILHKEFKFSFNRINVMFTRKLRHLFSCVLLILCSLCCLLLLLSLCLIEERAEFNGPHKASEWRHNNTRKETTG